MGSFLCKSGKGNYVASFVHVFGSSNGPYLYMDHSIPILPTNERIQKSLDYLIKEVNIPTRIVLCTILWDFRPFRSDVLFELWKDNNNSYIPFLDFRKQYIEREGPSFLRKFEKDTNARIDEIISLVQYHNSVSNNDDYVLTNIGLRTTPYYSDGGDLVRSMNDIVRKISSYRNLSLYDLDIDVWSKGNFNYSHHDFLFKDLQHPKGIIIHQNINKMMGRQFSLYYHYNSNSTTSRINHYCNFTYDYHSYHQHHHTLIAILNCDHYRVLGIKDQENNVYLLSYATNSSQVYR